MRLALRFRILVSVVGLRSAVADWTHRTLGVPSGPMHAEQRAHPLLLHPMWLREDSSDPEVFSQVFLEREYACLDDLPDVDWIVDCGANIGCSAAYFLSRFPASRLLALEPDPGNFDLLRRNLRPYGNRVVCLQAAVWSRPTRLHLSQDTFRDGREWTRQVRLPEPGDEDSLPGVDLSTLLRLSGRDRISLLKVDIEGAEAVVFSENTDAWLDRVDSIAIELHDDSAFGEATSVFFTAIRDQPFQISHSGELTICRRAPVPAQQDRGSSFRYR